MKAKSNARANPPRNAKLTFRDAGSLRSWIAVRDFLVDTLPGCEKGPPGGREVVRVAGKVLAYLAISERSRPPAAPANEDFVVVRIGLDQREHLLESNPDAYFVTPHYRNYPGVIVRLSMVDQKEFTRLLVDAWRLLAPKRLLHVAEEKAR
jgi:hypothetical protein